MILKYKSPKNLNLYIIKGQSYLVMDFKFFIMVSKSINIKLNSEFISFEFTKMTKEIADFLKRYSLWVNNLQKKLIKKILLKGLGLKMLLSEDNKNIEFKLGFSHTINIPIPELLTVKIHKNILTVSGHNSYFIGNFLYKIKSLKKINIYKGKGIWYKNENKKLKLIKKL